MPVGLTAPKSLLPVAGIRLAAMYSGIKTNSNCSDLVLIELSEPSQVAAVFTTNRFLAAPVIVAKEHRLKNKTIRYLLINSGNANAGTGVSGHQNAIRSCQAVANVTGVSETAVLPFSTGVIADQLPIAKIEAAIPELHARLNANAWLQAAQGIMTTDTLPKAISRTVQIGNANVTITGIAKGSGMIKPDMATMLAYVATDADIAAADMQGLLQQAVDCSFNAITVDGDTSTNDACVLIATGQSGVTVSAHDQPFKSALFAVFQYLAQSIIRDAEGATKFVEITVNTADSVSDAKEVAYVVAHSPLVKTALFAADPNWGRILAAIGRARVNKLDIGLVDLYLGDTCLLKNGQPDVDYTEARGQAAMAASDIKIRIELGLGSCTFKLWTSDLSYDYVRINAEYRS